MKIIPLFIFIFSGIINLPARILRSDTIIVNNTKFLFVRCTENNEESGNVDTICKVYRTENGSRKYLLKHTIYAMDGDCNTVFTDKGKYEIRGDSIIFFLEHGREGGPNPGLSDNSKQIYIVNADGKMILVYDADEYEGEWKLNSR